MNIKEVLRQASYLATPSPQEKAALELATKAVLDKLTTALVRKRLYAKPIIGGSFSRGTWLPGSTDVDCFVVFNRWLYKNQQISDLLDPVMELAFTHYKRLHGSRDYFQVEYDNYTFEFIPVIKIRKAKQALNITDASPLHVKWIKRRCLLSRMRRSIRLTKLFFKSAGVYGAESYIHGFSGYVSELLTIYYGSFLKLAKASQEWEKPVYIDPEGYYGNKSKAMKMLNAAKVLSPMVLVDPVQSDRNAAAALDIRKYSLLIKRFKEFLESPHIDFFCEKTITTEDIKQHGRSLRTVILEAKPTCDKKDIAGAKLLKQFRNLIKELQDNDFLIIEKGWQWKGLHSDALFWFYLPKKALTQMKKHYGPPVTVQKERIKSFLDKYGKKVKKEKGKYCVMLKREFTEPEDLLRTALREKEFKNVKFL